MTSRRFGRPSVRATAVIAAVLVTGLALSACGGKKNKAAPSLTTPAPTTSPTSATPKPTPTKPVAKLNPLTGVGGVPQGPVIAVKIDDTANGRPPVGLDKADVVYIEQVEGGLTRMLAIFATSKPTVEPVRSFRASDADLLVQYGPIAVVASGGGGQSLPKLDQAGFHGVINDRGAAGFFRDGGRPAPYNLGADLAAVARLNSKAGGVRDVGFRWAASDPRVARQRAGTSVNAVVGSTPVTYLWSTSHKKYFRTIGGSVLNTADQHGVGTPNVIVLFCHVTPDYADVDVAGNPSMHTVTTGHGRAVLFRDGKRIEGNWSRPTRSSPTTYADGHGKPLLFSPGGVNVILAANGSPL